MLQSLDQISIWLSKTGQIVLHTEHKTNCSANNTLELLISEILKCAITKNVEQESQHITVMTPFVGETNTLGFL